MARFALYLRRSTEEHQAASIEVQQEEALKYVTSKFGVFDLKHLYVDSGISRSEFKKRPGLLAMLAAAKKGEFDAIVTRDETRLGGDMLRTTMMLQELTERGINVFYYSSDTKVSMETSSDKLLTMVRNMAAEMEREKISGRTREHLKLKASKGYVTGGACYGYKTFDVEVGEIRKHVEYRIDEAEAQVIRRIFERYAAGYGLKAIAKELNEQRIPSPQRGKRGNGHWSPTCIQPMLRRKRYIGVQVWGQFEKAYRGGTKVRSPCPQKDWVIKEIPELRIVPQDLWNDVQERIKNNKSFSSSKDLKGTPPRYLLSGLSRCSECGGSIQVSNAKIGSTNTKVYGCSKHREQGNTVCPNTLRRPTEEVEASLLAHIKAFILTEEVVRKVSAEVRRCLEGRVSAAPSEVPAIERQVAQLKRELDRLADLVSGDGANVQTLMVKMRQKEEALSALEVRLVDLKAASSPPDFSAKEMEGIGRLKDLRGLLARNPEEARPVLQALLDGPLTLTARSTEQGRRFEISGTIKTGSMFRESSGNPASPAGTKISGTHRSQPDSLFDLRMPIRVLAILHLLTSK